MVHPGLMKTYRPRWTEFGSDGFSAFGSVLPDDDDVLGCAGRTRSP